MKLLKLIGFSLILMTYQAIASDYSTGGLKVGNGSDRAPSYFLDSDDVMIAPPSSVNDSLTQLPEFRGYIWPTQGKLTSGYGLRWGRMHRGIDIAAPIGTPIMAAASGVVISAGWNSGGYGKLVKVRHPDGSVTFYAHNSRLLVRRGQQVEQGQQIAEMGSTGYSTGPHLHFEVHPKGTGAVNPVALLPSR